MKWAHSPGKGGPGGAHETHCAEVSSTRVTGDDPSGEGI